FAGGAECTGDLLVGDRADARRDLWQQHLREGGEGRSGFPASPGLTDIGEDEGEVVPGRVLRGEGRGEAEVRSAVDVADPPGEASERELGSLERFVQAARVGAQLQAERRANRGQSRDAAGTKPRKKKEPAEDE